MYIRRARAGSDSAILETIQRHTYDDVPVVSDRRRLHSRSEAELLSHHHESIYSIPDEPDNYWPHHREAGIDSCSSLSHLSLRDKHKSVTDELKTALKSSNSKSSLTITVNLSSRRQSDGDTLSMDNFVEKKDFGDFQIFTDTPTKKRPFFDKAHSVDV